METHYKITSETHSSEHAVTLLLNGKFSEDALPALKQSIDMARAGHNRIYLDLSEVTLVDRKSVQYISDQAGQNITLVNCPIYLRRWITRVGDEVDS